MYLFNEYAGDRFSCYSSLVYEVSKEFVRVYRRSDHVRIVYGYVMLFPSGSDKFKLVMD